MLVEPIRGTTVTLPAKQRLIEAGKVLFAEHGFSGASVRDICAAADVGRNMIHHYFGSKDGLYSAVLDEFSAATFTVPLRVIAAEPKSAEEFQFKMEMFIAETLQALIENRLVFQILLRDEGGWLDSSNYRNALSAFLENSKLLGFLRPEAQSEMLPGLLLDRLGNQVIYALKLGESDEENVISNVEYRASWLAGNSDLILRGLASWA